MRPRFASPPVILRSVFGSVLFGLAVLPIILVVWRSVVPYSEPTLHHYGEAYSRSINYRAMLNTMLISSATVVFAGLIAIPSAWLVARTDLPARRQFRGILLLPYIIPPYLGAIAWINLANPSVGWLNRLAGAPMFDIYTIPGIVWVEGLFYYTFVYLSCLAAMETADPSLEEAARVSGAGPLRVLFTITLPMIRPAIYSGAFLVFAATAASFGVPALIGIPGSMASSSRRR
jgi:iron(III) transport system permease protein